MLGAGGRTGRAVLDELVRDGHEVLALTSFPDRLTSGGATLPSGQVEVRESRADSVAELASALRGSDALVDVAGPYAPRTTVGLEAALRAGVHYLDASMEPSATSRVHQQHDRVRDAGVVAVTAGGFPAAVLDLLGHAALRAAEGARELHVATTYLDRGWLRAAGGAATREVLAALLERPVAAVVGGVLVEEPVGEARRLAWFPRPVGLAHAAGVPGTAVLSIARRDPELTTVREYLAMSGWRAELLQLAASATGWTPARRWLRRGVRGPGAPSIDQRRRSVRWACVAETQGAQGTVRAWANGHDPAAAAAASLSVLVRAVVAHDGSGVRTPAQLSGPDTLLDELTHGRDLRWAVIRPDVP